MSEAVNFADLANTKIEDVERPPEMPEGFYEFTFAGAISEKKAKSGNVAIRFPAKMVQALDDVDHDALQQAGGLTDKSFPIDFWMSVDARFIFTEFCKGLEVPNELNLIEAANWLTENKPPFRAKLSYEADANDPERRYARISNVGPLEG